MQRICGNGDYPPYPNYLNLESLFSRWNPLKFHGGKHVKEALSILSMPLRGPLEGPEFRNSNLPPSFSAQSSRGNTKLKSGQRQQ